MKWNPKSQFLSSHNQSKSNNLHNLKKSLQPQPQ